MRQMLCRCQHQICLVGWTVPIFTSLHRRRRTSSSTHHAFIVILLVINNYFSSFNDVDLSHMMLVDCCVLCCQECGPIVAVWRWRPPWSIHSIAFYLNSANAKSNQKPITYPTKYLHQYWADEDGSSHHPLRMYGGQTLVLYGCTYLLLWGWRLEVNGQNTEKLAFYANKICRWAVAQRIPGRLGSPGYQIDPHGIPNSKHSLLFLIGSILGPFTLL